MEYFRSPHASRHGRPAGQRTARSEENAESLEAHLYHSNPGSSTRPDPRHPTMPYTRKFKNDAEFISDLRYASNALPGLELVALVRGPWGQRDGS